MKKKLLTCLLTTTLSLTMFNASVFAEVSNPKSLESTNNETYASGALSNSNLKLYFDSDFTDYYFETLDGDPSNPNDNNANLLYGSTNSEYAKIGNKIYNLQNIFKNNTEINIAEGYAISTAEIDGVVITRKLNFTKTTTTFNNALDIKYDIVNNNTEAQDVSLRLLLDIMLGDNDHAPFNVPGKESFYTQKSYTGSDIPSYWFAYDGLETPNIVTRGNFVPGSMPTKVQFVNWSDNQTIYSNWSPTIDESEPIGDSAVAMYWDDNIIQPGQSTTIRTNYGLDRLDSTATGELVSSLLGGENVEVSPNDDNTYNDYAANLVMENRGDANLQNITATINIPNEFANEMSLAANDSVDRHITTLQPNVSQNATWNLQFSDSYVDRNMYYTITISAEGVEPITLTQNILVESNLISAVDLVLNGGDAVSVNPNANNKYDNYLVDALVKNISNDNLENLDVTISIPDEFKNVISLVEANTTNNIETLAAGATSNEKWNLKISDSYEDRVAYYYVTVKVPGVDKDLVVKQRLNIKGLTKPEEPVTPPTPEEPKPETKPSGSLPNTGAEYPNALPIAGTVLTLLGVALFRNKR